ncbi:MAG: fatty acid biosynthesis transcriptional regulator [Sulfobacillus sp.]
MDLKQRRLQLVQALKQDPLVTDRDLANRLAVSVQTIRLDRLALGIPEVRARAWQVAEQVLEPRPLRPAGELLDIVPGESALSRLVTETTGADLERGLPAHSLFAQAEALLRELVPPGSETGLCRMKFRRAVRPGEVLVAKAEVIRRREGRWVILVTIRSTQEEVFRGKFVVAVAVGESA